MPGWKLRLLVVIGTALVGGAVVSTQRADTLDIYWIDVEGGSATLIVTPQRQSILMDAGWGSPDDRDARRVEAAMRDANISHIDYFIASHFHTDHTGGLPALADRVEINHFIDHGDSVEQELDNSRQAFAAYLGVAGGQRRTVTPGERLPLRGLDFKFVTAHGAVPDQPSIPMGPNVFCEGLEPVVDVSSENSRSVGYLLSLGGFQFLNLGDLTVDVQHRLACPEHLLGDVDVFQVPHHGDGVAPQLAWALGYSVAVISNGPRKGGSATGYHTVAQSPGIQDVWQLHRPLDAPGVGDSDVATHTDEALTANLTGEDECEGHWVKAVVHPDGRTYSVTNGRTGTSRSYFSR